MIKSVWSIASDACNVGCASAHAHASACLPVAKSPKKSNRVMPLAIAALFAALIFASLVGVTPAAAVQTDFAEDDCQLQLTQEAVDPCYSPSDGGHVLIVANGIDEAELTNLIAQASPDACDAGSEEGAGSGEGTDLSASVEGSEGVSASGVTETGSSAGADTASAGADTASTGGESKQEDEYNIAAVLTKDGNLFIYCEKNQLANGNATNENTKDTPQGNGSETNQTGTVNSGGSAGDKTFGGVANNGGNGAGGNSGENSESGEGANGSGSTDQGNQSSNDQAGNAGQGQQGTGSEASGEQAGSIGLGGDTDQAGLNATLPHYDVGNGVIAEGQTAPWYADRSQILSVSFGAGVKPESMAGWFSGLSNLVNIDFSNLDTSVVTSMQRVFSECGSLVKLNLSSFDTHNVTCMSGMFSGCASVKDLNLTSFDTSNVNDMSDMFAGSSSLKTVDVSKFNTGKVTKMSSMFKGCSSIEMLDLSSFDTSNVKNMEGMFEGCTSLAALDVSGFSAEQLKTASVPTDNKGGFWRLNVPKGYDPGITLREPTAAERKAAGLNENPGYNSGKDQEGEKGNSGTNPDDGANKGKTVDPGKDPSKDSPAQPADKGGATGSGSNQGGEASNGESISTADEDDMPFASTASMPIGQQAATAGIDSQRGFSLPVSTAMMDALSALATSLLTSAFAPSLDPAIDFEEVANTTTSILNALGVSAVVDKTAAMIAAALGMMIAAGLILTLCMKIR